MPTLTDEAFAYHDQLIDDQAALDWHHERGITRATIREFHLGVIRQPFSAAAEPYVGAPTIPYTSSLGKVIELKARPGREKLKYIPLGTDYPLAIKTHLFNAAQAIPSRRRRQVLVCEGEYDAMIATQCGLRAVACPGVSRWRDEWCYLFEESEVIIAWDSDEAGRTGANRLMSRLGKYRVRARAVSLPEGMDVTDVYLAGGRKAVEGLMRA